jgi:hypothetical protein
MSDISPTARRLAAVSAILVAPLSYASTGLYLWVTGGDTTGVLKPTLMLSLPEKMQHLFALSMIFDAFGLYTLLLIAGGYLWTRLRPTSKSLDDIAVLALVLFSALGITGAVLLCSSLPALSQAHLAADPATRAAAEVAWLALASGVDRGLWVFAYLPIAIWCLLTAPRLRAIGARHGWLLMTLGVAWALYFAGGMLELVGVIPPAASDLVEAPGLFALAVTPLWALLSGIDLLRPERP